MAVKNNQNGDKLQNGATANSGSAAQSGASSHNAVTAHNSVTAQNNTSARGSTVTRFDESELAFLVSANDGLTAEVYENMLLENGIPVVKRKVEPNVKGYIYIDYAKDGVNIFVPAEKLIKARELLEEFDSESYSYDIPMEEYQRRLRGKRSVIGVIMLLFIFGVPIASAIFVIIYYLFFKK